MTLLDQHRAHNRKMIEERGFQTEINMKSDTEPVVERDTTGTVMFHSVVIDPETGLEMIGVQCTIEVSIPGLIELGYPVFRDVENPNDVKFGGDIISFVDAKGISQTMSVKPAVRPDNTLGCCTLYLSEME